LKGLSYGLSQFIITIIYYWAWAYSTSILKLSVNRVPACRGVFACVGWQVTLCDPIRQVTLRSCEMDFHK